MSTMQRVRGSSSSRVTVVIKPQQLDRRHPKTCKKKLCCDIGGTDAELRFQFGRHIVTTRLVSLGQRWPARHLRHNKNIGHTYRQLRSYTAAYPPFLWRQHSNLIVVAPPNNVSDDYPIPWRCDPPPSINS
ncbi:uncharacterized protein LOC117782623 [Drosophila innubila]|uniref:uncharacterized protein LOC117782623 n=1 Tax=Drosophila innubila TaxID=198719 RepID=UPI00148DF6FE|nr:uncharacterized protein LOC117782623 [Drosophila innubila]